VHVDAGQVHGVRVELAGLDELLDLGDGHPSGHRRERVEVAGRLVEHEVAVAVALPRPHQAEVGDDRALEDELLVLAVDLEGLGLLAR
jgi:hypothetical protein